MASKVDAKNFGSRKIASGWCLLLAGLLLALSVGSTQAASASLRPMATDASGTRQECMAKLLQPPHDITAAMLNPHKTEILTKGTYSDVEGCDSWERLGKFRVQLKQRGQWRDLNGNFWYPTDSFYKGGKNEAHAFCFGDFETHDGVREEREHGHWQPARVRFINFVKDVKTGKVVAHGTIKDHPVTLGYSGPC